MVKELEIKSGPLFDFCHREIEVIFVFILYGTEAGPGVSGAYGVCGVPAPIYGITSPFYPGFGSHPFGVIRSFRCYGIWCLESAENHRYLGFRRVYLGLYFGLVLGFWGMAFVFGSSRCLGVRRLEPGEKVFDAF